MQILFENKIIIHHNNLIISIFPLHSVSLEPLGVAEKHQYNILGDEYNTLHMKPIFCQSE